MAEFLIPDTQTPVRIGKIVCIGRNYAKHAAEMSASIPEEPVVFLKPSTAVIGSGDVIRLPEQSTEIHHEVEIVVAIGRTTRNVSSEDALDAVTGYALGLDLTARDLQAAAKQAGRPWAVAKGFDTFAPLGPFVSPIAVEDSRQLEFSLEINGLLVQSGSTSDMIFSIAELISYCSAIFTLELGDLIFTGTPEGVGPVTTGDVLHARGAGLEDLIVSVE